MGIAVGVFYLTPVLACLIRLHDENMENKSPLDQMQIWLFRGLRAALLLAFLWLALDPVVGPRGILWHHLKVELPLLSFDYLCGLAAGYLAGTTLLASLGTAEAIPFMRLGGQAALWLERSMVPIIAGLVLVTGGLLVERNLPVILTENRESPRAYGELAVRSLPAGGGIVLSDFPEQLAVFQAALAGRPDAQQWLPVDTQALPVREYRERLAKRHPGDWQLAATNADGLSLNQTLELFNSMVSSNRVFYLHTGFGSFCEFFYLAPVGSLFELKRFTNSAIQPPVLSADVMAQNEKFWDDDAAQIGSLQSSAPVAAKPSTFEKKLHLEPARSRHPAELREWLSVTLDAWGVALQREGNLPAAGHRFEQALGVNPDNWVANANLFCNTNLAAKAVLSTDQVPSLTSQFGNLQTFLLATAHFGPPDEPNFCLLAGAAFEQRGLLRQALQQYQRASELAPDTMAPQLALVPLYLRCHLLEPADQTIARLEDEVKTHPEAQPLALTVALFRANLCLVQTNFAGARAIYQKILQENPGNTDLANTIGRNYMTVGDYDDANNLASELLAQHPEDIQLMQAKSGTLIKSGHPTEAMALLDHILAQTNTIAAQLNHAMAQFQTGHYDAARNEYLALQATTASPFIVDLGLAETSLRLQDTNGAAQYFAQCLTNLPPESPQAGTIRNRLQSLQVGGGH
jgi:tetratricopeptide (TPR) repeat protein